MKNKLPLISIATTLTSISCLGNPINGEWNLDETEEECQVVNGDGYTVTLCFTFTDFDLSITEGEIDDVEGEVEINMTYSYDGETDSYSIDSDFELKDLDLTGESPSYQIEGDLLIEEFETENKVELDCTLTDKTKLDCDIEFELEPDDTTSIDYKMNAIFEKSE